MEPGPSHEMEMGCGNVLFLFFMSPITFSLFWDFLHARGTSEGVLAVDEREQRQ